MSASDAAVLLAVDIDGTLHGGDLLLEGVLQFTASCGTGIFTLPFWLLAGYAGHLNPSCQGIAPGGILIYKDIARKPLGAALAN